MNDRMPPEMAEATRLTRAGRLAEATALIQRMLGGGKGNGARDAAPAGSDTIIDLKPVSSTVNEPTDPEPAAHRPGLRDFLRDLAAKVTPAGRGAHLDGAAQPFARQHQEPLPDGASFAERSYTGSEGSRLYKLFVPGGRAGQRLPLVVMLHGCTQSPDDFAAGTGMNAVAQEHGVIVAYPAQPPSANAQKCWNWFDPDSQQRGRGEAAILAGLTRQILRDHPVDPARVYIAGLSAGGAAAAIMGAAYPDLYAAIGVHSGLACGAARDLPSAFAAMSRGGTPTGQRTDGRIVPTIVFHGDKDKTVHPRNGDAVLAQAKADTRSQTSVQSGQVPGGHAYSRTVHTDPAGKALWEQWTIHGAGHAWAGGSAAGTYTDPRGPDATREMLRFFLEHRHPAPDVV